MSILCELPYYREAGASYRKRHRFRGMHPPQHCFSLDVGFMLALHKSEKPPKNILGINQFETERTP
jgi:hypothetical protein